MLTSLLSSRVGRTITVAAVGVLVIAGAVWGARLAYRRHVAGIEARTRIAVEATSRATLDSAHDVIAALAARNTVLARAVDSASTRLTAALSRARTITRDTPAPLIAPPVIAPPVIGPVAQLPTDSALPQCRAALDGLADACARYREHAEAALDNAASLRRTQDASFAAMSASAAARQHRDSVHIAGLIANAVRGARWRTSERAVCAVSIATNVIQWRVR